MSEVGAGEMIAPIAPAPIIPFHLMHASAVQLTARVAVRHWVAAVQSETAAARVEARGHAAAVETAAATARVRITPREHNAGDADGNNRCNRSEQHSGSIPHEVTVNADADKHCPATASQLRRLRRDKRVRWLKFIIPPVVSAWA